jgi:4,5-DOPA dioxygenase extradiol
MDRSEFIKKLALLPLTAAAMKLSEFSKITEGLISTEKMPALFIGHGSPMNAIEDNEFSRSWKKLGSDLPHPRAILCISAHWLTKGTKVTAASKPETIHDFGGFPDKLFAQQYPAPGSPEFAEETIKTVTSVSIEKDHEWGLDHGTWSVLLPMYPKADIPVFQLSLDYSKPPVYHYQLAKELAVLRRKGVLIIGSGNIVHNLGMINWNGGAYDWAKQFDEEVKKRVLSKEHNDLIHYENLGRAAQLSIPTNDHYLPLLYILAMQDNKDEVSFFNENVDLGSVSMRSVKLS